MNVWVCAPRFRVQAKKLRKGFFPHHVIFLRSFIYNTSNTNCYDHNSKNNEEARNEERDGNVFSDNEIEELKCGTKKYKVYCTVPLVLTSLQLPLVPNRTEQSHEYFPTISLRITRTWDFAVTAPAVTPPPGTFCQNVEDIFLNQWYLIWHNNVWDLIHHFNTYNHFKQ